jgi:large subunit ribosomal protein L21
MKKAVIAVGGRQYLVKEGDEIVVNYLNSSSDEVKFKPLAVWEDKSISIGQPEVEGSVVSAKVDNAMQKGDKVVSIRYKAKKRVKTVRGHRQLETKLSIKKIS